ncbi:MAG: phage minor capsid protein [Ruminococcus sp.]
MNSFRKCLKRENTQKEYNGKQYTTYEALQQQRKMERGMRAQRQKIKLLQQGGADEQEIILAKAKYQGQMQTYKDFSEKMKLQNRKPESCRMV